MKVEIKSMFLGIALGGIGVFSILFLIGNVETEFSLSTVDNNQNKNIEVSIERTIENGEDLTNVVIKGEVAFIKNVSNVIFSSISFSSSLKLYPVNHSITLCSSSLCRFFFSILLT